nr:RNA-directed DNA polymerase, eukaryota, reverse transcriptase zinc-binding domain protein [Tanacetum cinerariifolium]
STNNKAAGDKGYAKTFVNVVKDNSMENELSSTIVLDDDCLNTKELNTSLLGRVKEFASFSNLKKVLCDEGFDDIKISYMGEFWVLLEFDFIKTKDAFSSNVGVGSWFSALRQASNEFIAEARIAWVEVEGIIFILKDYAYVHNYARTFLRALKLCSEAKFIGFVLRRFQVGFWSFWKNRRKMFFQMRVLAKKKNDGGGVPDIDEVPETDFEETDGLKEAKTNGDQTKSVNGNNPNDKSNDVQVEHDGNSIAQASKISNSDSIGPGRFKKVNGFDKLVMNSWYDAPSHGNNAILSFMSKIDAEIDNGNGNADIVARRLVIINELQCISKSQVAETAQKIKIRWCVEGDENSKFFHGMLNKKRSQSNIRGVLINGKWTDDPVKFKGEFFRHFSNRFGKPSDDRVEIDMNFPNTLSVVQKADLESMVTIEEVKRAVWDCGSDKAPGPDRYTFSFYRHFWSTIEKDVFAAVQYFFAHGDIPKGCNSTFITLIPKIPGANMVKDFRPISLIGSFYKIIAKVLTNRLVGVLGDIVNEVQSAFIANRQILDGPFIVNEVIQWCKKKKKQALIFKVDFEKAYDSVRWDYLDDVLDKYGFGIKWRGWIQNCLRSFRGSILINGSPTEEFQIFKGLKQGDPLSPFLFILVMESLHISFQRVVDAGLYT